MLLAVILIFVIPVFEEMFADFGSALPVPTQMVVSMSDFAKSNALYVFIALILFGFAFRLRLFLCWRSAAAIFLSFSAIFLALHICQ